MFRSRHLLPPLDGRVNWNPVGYSTGCILLLTTSVTNSFVEEKTRVSINFWGICTLLFFLFCAVPLGAETHKLRLSEDEVTKIATDILLGDPYGQNEAEVRRNIVGVTYTTAAPCDERPAWQVTVHVPAGTESGAIDGTLTINDLDGKPVCVGLPFLDGVELSELPLDSFINSEPGSETTSIPPVAEATSETTTVDVPVTLLDLLQQIEDRYTHSETLSGTERADELATIRTLLERVADEYPASNEALSLALGDKVGSIDPVALDAELAAAETDGQEPELTAVTTTDPTLATLSVCFPQNEQPEGSDGPSARITIQVELDAEGKIVGMPDFVEPATPDEAARKLFQRSLIALDSCAELKTLSLPTAIEMSLTAVGVDRAVLKPGVQPSEPPLPNTPPIAVEGPPEITLEPVWAVANDTTEKALDLQRTDIVELQVRLGLLGFDPNGVDGVIGRGVRKAINDWQITRSIPPSGYLDERQITAIKTESQDAFSGWIAEGTNADILAKASKPPKIEVDPSTERAKTPKRPKDCISFEGVTTCL